MSILKDKKEKLGIDSLGIDNQKKLYEDFVDAGGKVVELKQGPQQKINDQLEKWIQNKEDEQKRRLIDEQKKEEDELARKRAQANRERLQNLIEKNAGPKEKKSVLQELKHEIKINKEKEQNPAQEYFGRLAAKIVCILYGVFGFWGRHFSRNFLDLTLYDLKNSLIESQQILVSVLHQDKDFSDEIRKSLKESGYPYYFELIYRFYLIFDDEVFNLIRELRTAENPIQRGKFVFVKLFKKILVLSRYHPSLPNAFQRALTIEKTNRHLTDNVVDFNLRKLFHTYNFIFYKYYPKILNLVDYYYKDELFLGRKISYSEFLAITEMDAIGYYTKLWEEEEAREKQKLEQKEKSKHYKSEEQPAEQKQEVSGLESDLSNLPEEIASGIRRIREMSNFKGILDYYNEVKDPRMSIPVYDKAFLAGTLLEIFDKEYSFLFIASNVQFNIFFDRGQRKDIKSVLKDLYFHIDDVYKRLYEYGRVISGIKKVKEDSFMPSKEKTVKLEQLKFQKTTISRAVRSQTQNIIGDFQKHLQVVLADYKADKYFIQNPDEVLSYETNIAGKKIGHKDTVVNIFKQAYYFSSALYFLVQDGELSGGYLNLKNPVYLAGLVQEPGEGEDAEEGEGSSGF